MRELIITDKNNIVAIADAIRAKIESSDGMTIEEMAELIGGIETGGDELWAYLNLTTLHLSRADQFSQNGNILEVQYG